MTQAAAAIARNDDLAQPEKAERPRLSRGDVGKRKHGSTGLDKMQRKWLKMSPARPWAQIYIDVIDGDAWRGLSINARRILDALILLHFENKQAENGKLQISYTQFADVGVRRKSIAAALRELEGARMIVKGKGVATTNLPVRPLLYGLPMYFVAATGGIVNAGSRRFAWVPLDILESGAWRGLSINARRMMDRLLIENARHMGEKNGSLRVSFLQFEGYGIGRQYIAPAVAELAAAGLIAITRGKGGGARKPPNLYRLAFLGTVDGPATWQKATDKVFPLGADRIPAQGANYTLAQGADRILATDAA
jgi:hypothetical protein